MVKLFNNYIPTENKIVVDYFQNLGYFEALRAVESRVEQFSDLILTWDINSIGYDTFVLVVVPKSTVNVFQFRLLYEVKVEVDL